MQELGLLRARTAWTKATGDNRSGIVIYEYVSKYCCPDFSEAPETLYRDSAFMSFLGEVPPWSLGRSLLAKFVAKPAAKFVKFVQVNFPF